MNKFFILTIGILYCFSPKSYSQGCSDAGFCTIGSLAPLTESDTAYKHIAKLSLSYGKGEQGTSHLHIIPELEFGFLKNNTLQIKVPYISVTGNLGSNSGIGDVAISISRKLIAKEKSQLAITIGSKLPTGTTNKNTNGTSFPMPYQTGLGTFDLILGASYQYRAWRAGTGYQKVLSNKNENTFLHLPGSSSDANTYFESNLLERGDDALLRIERTFNLQKIKLTAGLLAIYRLEKDKITGPDGQQMELSGSDGLTLNLNGGVQYEFSGHSGISLIFGAPSIVRKVRADGLTRKMVLTVAYSFHFR